MATAKKAADKSTPAAKKRSPNAAFMKPLKPSAELAAVVGADPLPRTQVISKLWEYIKKHDLQDPANRRMINADDKLKEVFDKPQVIARDATSHGPSQAAVSDEVDVASQSPGSALHLMRNAALAHLRINPIIRFCCTAT